MSHFAKVIFDKVVEVIVAEQDFIDNYVNDVPCEWVQTSYNTHANQHPEGRPLRGNYAGIGYTYDKENDVFYAPQPYPSWTLNKDTWLWEPPVPCPIDDKKYAWDDFNQLWVEVK